MILLSANSILTAEKRRLDSELRGLQQELENLIAQMKNSEEKARKAMGDAGSSNLICWKQKWKKNFVFEMENARAAETVKFTLLNQKT